MLRLIVHDKPVVPGLFLGCELQPTSINQSEIVPKSLRQSQSEADDRYKQKLIKWNESIDDTIARRQFLLEILFKTCHDHQYTRETFYKTWFIFVKYQSSLECNNSDEIKTNTKSRKRPNPMSNIVLNLFASLSISYKFDQYLCRDHLLDLRGEGDNKNYVLIKDFKLDHKKIFERENEIRQTMHNSGCGRSEIDIEPPGPNFWLHQLLLQARLKIQEYDGNDMFKELFIKRLWCYYTCLQFIQLCDAILFNNYPYQINGSKNSLSTTEIVGVSFNIQYRHFPEQFRLELITETFCWQDDENQSRGKLVQDLANDILHNKLFHHLLYCPQLIWSNVSTKKDEKEFVLENGEVYDRRDINDDQPVWSMVPNYDSNKHLKLK